MQIYHCGIFVDFLTTWDNFPPLNMLVVLSWLHLQYNIQIIPRHATNHVTCDFVDMALLYKLHSNSKVLKKLMLSTLFINHIIRSSHYLKSMLYIPCEVLHQWKAFEFGVWRGSSTNNFMANLRAAYVSLPSAISSAPLRKFTIANQSIELRCLMWLHMYDFYAQGPSSRIWESSIC